MKLEILDTTLRDGEQGAGVEFSPSDKLDVIHTLDALGVSYIEAGMITDRKSREFFASLSGVNLQNSKLAVFTQTVRAGESAEDSALLRDAADAPVPVAVIYGKSWLYQVTEVLGSTGEENLRMIRESIAYLVSRGKEVIFDAEHFFDGYSDSPAYAMDVLEAAHDAGASRLILCDTNGGMLPDVVGMIARAVCEKFGGVGIHCHNDMGMAVACSISAVLSGAVQVHGTISGIGERCGNANLNTLIPVLQLKLGFDCIGERIKSLTASARRVNESANLSFSENEPFVGGYSFTHKAGAHIDGVKKSPRTFEHISPASVGNERNLLVSGLSGRAALLDKMNTYVRELGIEGFEGGFESKNDPRVLRAAEILREKESEGYDYEDAAASLALLIDDALGIRRHFFRLLELKIIVDEKAEKADAEFSESDAFASSAIIKIEVGGREELTAGEGNGPVNAMDAALRRALRHFYPEIADMHLTDYRVRVLDSQATASSVRVSIESTDGKRVWRTVGVSRDVINASWQALCDSVEFMLRG